MAYLVRQLYLKLLHAPPPESNSFQGQTVLVTGGTTGLGLAAAIHFVNLGASQVIITCRNEQRGQLAKAKIEEATNTSGEGRVTIMKLDMNHYLSCVAFVEELKRDWAGKGGIGYIVLNAGVLNVSFVESPEGW
jgi:NAD(P)-dependent dehydrogenase (short-subunit alcohol dehydrogenase family)